MLKLQLVMAYFFYKVVKNDKKTSGTIFAPNIDCAKDVLKQCGFDILSIKKHFFTISFEKKLSQKELINFFSAMSSMDKVGVDVLQALELMKDDVAITYNLKKICEKIYFSVANGKTLSQACEQASKSFTHDFIGLIKIAEDTGKFSAVFEKIVEYIKWNYDIKNRAKKAIRGPLFTIGFVCVMIISMSTLILPKILDFISYFKIETPKYTLALIGFSNFVREKWATTIFIIGLIFIIIQLLKYTSHEFWLKIDYLKLKIPIFGELYKKLDTSRFIAFFGLMYNNGADILDILTSVSNVLQNKYFSSRIIHVKQKIMDGTSIFEAIDNEKVFPKMFRKMFAVCEKTGEVDDVLNNIKYFYDKETKDTTDKIVEILKPMTTILLGAMVAWMGSAMLGPIYMNIGNIGEISSNNSIGY